jgi:hypothetical protein
VTPERQEERVAETKPKTLPRYRFMRDEDCHDYIILVGEEENFRKWLDAVYNDKEYDGPPFDDLRCDSPRQYEWCYPSDVEKLEAEHAEMLAALRAFCHAEEHSPKTGRGELFREAWAQARAVIRKAGRS